MLTISSALCLRLRRSFPVTRNWITHAGRMKITEESSYFLSTREASLPTSSTRVLFDFLRRPAPSFVIWRRSDERGRENHSCSVLSFPTAFEREWPRTPPPRETGQTSSIYPVIPATPLIRKGFRGDLITREQIIPPPLEPQDTRRCTKLCSFRDRFSLL